MYFQPVPLIPNTSPWAIASGSTATAAIGQIVAMNVVTSMSWRKCFVDATYATSSSIATKPNTFPSSEASPLAGALNNTSAHAAEREQREHERARIDVLLEQPGAGRHDEERGERSDQRGVGDAVVRRAGEEDGQVQAEEDTRHERLAQIPQRDPPARAPEQDVPDDADGDHPPERDQDAGRLGALHERRAEREGDDQTDDREHPEVFALIARVLPGSPASTDRIASWPAMARSPVPGATTSQASRAVSNTSLTRTGAPRDRRRRARLEDVRAPEGSGLETSAAAASLVAAVAAST